jgi:hypothetical protein
VEDSANDSFVDDNGSVFEVESKSEAETEHEEELHLCFGLRRFFFAYIEYQAHSATYVLRS